MKTTKHTAQILDTLFRYGRLPTNRIRAIVGLTHTTALKILGEMWEQGDIHGEVETNATYWSLPSQEERGSTPTDTTVSDTSSLSTHNDEVKL